jgi:hypothetical protein
MTLHSWPGAILYPVVTDEVMPMRPGPLPHPKRKLNPGLRTAAVEAMRAKNPPGVVLALVSGFTHQSVLSNALHNRRVSATPLTISRLQRLAEAVGFSGALFLEEVER